MKMNRDLHFTISILLHDIDGRLEASTAEQAFDVVENITLLFIQFEFYYIQHCCPASETTKNMCRYTGVGGGKFLKFIVLIWR